MLLWGAFCDTGKALTCFLILDFVGKGTTPFIVVGGMQDLEQRLVI